MQTDAGFRLQIKMFGGLQAIGANGVTVRFRPQKPGALLAYLAFHLGPMHARDELVELFWPEIDPQVGRNRLKQTLSVLRSELEPVSGSDDRFLLADRATIGLNPEWLVTDVAEFEQRRHEASQCAPPTKVERIVQALDTYRGILLPGFYEDWTVRARERLANAHLASRLDLLLLLEQADDLDRAIQCGRTVVQADPLCEEAHGVLMRLYVRLGRPEEAMRQYRDLKKSLSDDMGAQPSRALQALLSEIHTGAIVDQYTVPSVSPPEPIGGAVVLSSPFYIVRPTDREFTTALKRNDSIVLVKGPRQVGKTSLLARGLAQARDAGARVVLTDLQQCTSEQLQSADTLFRTLADTIADQLDLDIKVSDVWDVARGWNVNFERFIRREVLLRAEGQLVWGLDEIDRLFPYPYSAEVFALFRSWHNLRSLHPAGPWSRLTQAIAYATEAHLFIADLNQSPFNVGTRLTLDDFTLEQVADLNHRYGSPLGDSTLLAHLYDWLGGHPYLIRRTLHELSHQNLDLTLYKELAEREHGPFHDHLRYLIEPIIGDPALITTVREALHGDHCADARSFYRLRSAGVLAGEPAEARLRCALYADYLRRSLP